MLTWARHKVYMFGFGKGGSRGVDCTQLKKKEPVRE